MRIVIANWKMNLLSKDIEAFCAACVAGYKPKPGVEAGIAGFLNDPQNQAVALAAVKAAIDQGFRGQDAWTAARAALEARLTASGRQVAGTVMDTILQNAYCAVKYAVANHPEVDVPSAPSVQ